MTAPKEFPEHAQAHALMCQFYETAQVGLREALREGDPERFALYHPGDAMPEWLREGDAALETEENADVAQGDVVPFAGLKTWISDAQKWNIPDQNGEYEWRLGCPFWPNFHHAEMPSYGLPPSYAQIDWRDPRQTRAWLRFCVWFYPLVVAKAENPAHPMPPEVFAEAVQIFMDVARGLDAYIPREEGEDALFED